jgi:hypothetical protein
MIQTLMRKALSMSFGNVMFLSVVMVVGAASCGGPDNSVQVEQERKDSIERARAAMEAAREAALIKARMEDSLEQLMMTDSLESAETK